MKKRTIVFFMVTSLLLALGTVVSSAVGEFDRLGLIRITKDLPIPEWVKAWIWGWR